jgi:hypothetical protein
MKKLLILFFLKNLFLVPTSVYADDGVNQEHKLVSGDEQTTVTDPSLNIVLSNNYIHLSDEVSRLQSMVYSQNKAIEDLRSQLSKKSEGVDKSIDFPAWTSFLLAASTLITAGVGIAVAILSFFGYQEILNKSTSAAKLTAEKVATEISKEKIDTEIRTKVVQGIQDFSESSMFAKIIDERISIIIYRGISDVSPLESATNDTSPAA